MCDELRGRFLIHPWRWAGLQRVMHQPPDAPAVRHFVELVLLDDFAQIRAGPHPVALLDDAAVHVRDVERAVRRVRDIERAKARIARPPELGFLVLVRIAQHRESVLIRDLRAADEPPHRLAHEQVPAQFRGQPVAAVHVAAGRRRKMIHRPVRAMPPVPALHIRHADGRPHFHETRSHLLLRIERAVHHRLLKTLRPLLAARVHEKHLPEIILAQPPLPVVRRGVLLHRARWRPAQAVVVVGRVEAVVAAPQQPVWLMLQISPARPAREKRLLFIRHAVAVRVRVGEQIIRVRLAHDDAPFVQRHEHPRQHQPVDENAVPVIHAVAFRRPMQRDAARFGQLILAVDLLHVAAKFRHENPPVAIKRRDHRLLDVRLAQHQLRMVAGRQLESLRLLLRRARLNRRHGWKFVRFFRGKAAGAQGGERGEDRTGKRSREFFHGRVRKMSTVKRRGQAEP